MTRARLWIGWIWLALALLGAVPAAAEPLVVRELEVFVQDGCSHCAEAEPWLELLAAEHPELTLVRRNLSAEPGAVLRYEALLSDRGLTVGGTPSFLVADQLLIGWSAENTPDEVLGLLRGERPSRGVQLPVFGEVDADTIGLPLFTIALGLVDGFNPCAMWVLMFLLSMLVHLRDRAKMFLIGGTFVLVSGAVYFAFMSAWLNVFLLIGLSRPVQIVLGLIAAGMASVHIKDFFAFKQGPSLSIPESAKGGIVERVRKVLKAEHLLGSMVGVVVLAVLVNLVELLCTAGLPALYTQVLTAHALPKAGYYAYLVLYNLAYMFDDGLMLTVAVVTLSHRKLQERGGRQLKLLSGLVMLALGLALIFAPDLLIW